MCVCGSKRKRSVHWTRAFGYKNNLLEYVWHVGSVGRNIPKRNARVMYQMCLLPYKIHSLLRALTGSYRNEKCGCLQWALIPQPLEKFDTCCTAVPAKYMLNGRGFVNGKTTRRLEHIETRDGNNLKQHCIKLRNWLQEWWYQIWKSPFFARNCIWIIECVHNFRR